MSTLLTTSGILHVCGQHLLKDIRLTYPGSPTNNDYLEIPEDIISSSRDVDNLDSQKWYNDNNTAILNFNSTPFYLVEIEPRHDDVSIALMVLADQWNPYESKRHYENERRDKNIIYHENDKYFYHWQSRKDEESRDELRQCSNYCGDEQVGDNSTKEEWAFNNDVYHYYNHAQGSKLVAEESTLVAALLVLAANNLSSKGSARINQLVENISSIGSLNNSDFHYKYWRSVNVLDSKESSFPSIMTAASVV